MDYNPGGPSPDPYGGGGSIHLVCPCCEFGDDYTADDAEDGFFTCRMFSAVHITQATVADPNDFQATGNVSVRRVATQPARFAPVAGAWGEPEDLAARVRWRYVRGLQVFDDMWARQMIAEHDAAGREKRSGCGDNNNKPDELKSEWEDDIFPRQKDRRRVEFAFLRSLRMLLPIYSTLAVCFLACHIAREAILPTGIYKWVMEGKIPFLAVCTEVDRLLGSSLQLQDCPLDARRLFRPDLSLPVDKILPQACRIYEWAMPAELWLSSNPAKVPTRVYVMAILVVTLRVLYNINGQGIWEKICEEGRNTSGSDADANAPTFKKLDDSNSEEFGIRELLCAIADAYDKINVSHDYSSDLRSYLKYCKEVIFTGITVSKEKEHLIEIFSDMYNAREDDNPKEHVKSQSQVNKRCRDGTFVEASCISSSSGHDAMQILVAEMQDHGFHYMPPRKPRKSDGYLRCRRRLSGGFMYVAHADYYMLLRAFAKLAEVDVRIMHISVLKLERGLACIEDRIERSLNTLQNLSSRTRDELKSVSN
ncbi:hypothetical protein PAHAL_3G323200 [Panicum hallii]|uniref:TATA box-binding protein-associated factor RNA polymerase I subunit B n=1 Tax=Panicum hallii TaxID=206008 RepID=A0A2T8KK37_9POAL|nr:hypothetical protein PAHAL_3G323200 [Panicum hallii]